MTASAAAVGSRELLALPDYERGHAAAGGRAGAIELQDAERPEVQAPVKSIGRRVHDVTVLSALAGIQLLWLVTLAYGLWLLA